MPRILALAMLFILSAAGSAGAASCHAVIGDVRFGAVDNLTAAPVDIVSSVRVECDQIAAAAQAVIVCLGIGPGTGGQNGGFRRMTSGSRRLDFQLYQDSGRSIGWGSAADPALGPPRRVALPVSGETASVAVPLYGRVFGGQAGAGTGSYVSSFSGADASYTYAEDALDCDAPGGEGSGQSAFTVDAAIAANCLVEASDIEFGQHALIDRNVDAEGAVAVTCTPGTDYSITLGGGLRNSADPEQRILQSGGDQARYGLYQDAARSRPWGSSLQTLLPGTGAGTRQSVTVYGRVPPQPLPPGKYSDTVNVTITYDEAP